MTTASIPIQPHTRSREKAVEDVGARRLVVPIGGTGWGWGLLARFTLIFSLGQAFSNLPWNPLSQYFYYLSYGASVWAGKTFPLFPAPEADQRFYMHLIPLLIAAVWLVIDRRRKHDVAIHEIGQVLARYSIAFILSSYALEKTFGGQGSGTYTEYSGLLPMYGVQSRGFATFLWLGQSIVYENFAALVELLPLFLIPFRRTAFWGALIAFAACLNVFIVNTGHWNNGLSLTPIAMIAMPICLLIPYTKRLAQFFTSTPTEPMAVGYLTPPRWYWPLGAVSKTAVIAWGLYAHNHFFVAGPDYWSSPLGGLYRVETFTRNGREEPFDAAYPNRWREVTIGTAAQDISYLTIDNERVNYHFKLPVVDQRREHSLEKWVGITSAPNGDLPFSGGMATGLEHGTLSIGERSYASQALVMRQDSGTIHYTHPTPDAVTLAGVIGKDTITAQLKRISIEDEPLYKYTSTGSTPNAGAK
jgi:hypothetical protein